ncbi:MAG: chemotaxis response regulator protein-glutamate methylesterase [Candidatus Korobacteraceae bacterium]
MSVLSRKTRVLVVDDSVVMRRLLSEVISSDPELEVAGYAANGQIALALLDKVSPDIVTLDVEMPVMNGLETLKAMRGARRMLPVIMFSTLTERGAEATIESLALGASDYVAKPAGGGDYNSARERIREALLPRIKALCGRSIATLPAKSPLPRSLTARAIRARDRIEVVAIGCSTGGPNALAQILPALPADFPVPLLVVQHMPPAFTRFLAQRLNGLCQLPVEEGRKGEMVKPGTMWIAPGGYHMGVTREGDDTRLCISSEPPENSCRPSVDVLFRSVAQIFSRRALAVVLTGMGQDGLRGCELLSEQGAQIAVQDEASSVVWGMPGFVARAGLADAVLPLSDIGSYIVERVSAFRPLKTNRTHVAAVAR